MISPCGGGYMQYITLWISLIWGVKVQYTKFYVIAIVIKARDINSIEATFNFVTIYRFNDVLWYIAYKMKSRHMVVYSAAQEAGVPHLWIYLQEEQLHNFRAYVTSCLLY